MDIKSFLSIVFIKALLVSLVRADCSRFLYDIISCYELFGVSPITTHIPLSIITLCDQYWPICDGGKEVFLECYKNAISSCDEDKRKYNPMIMEELTVKAVLNGCCAKKQDFIDGQQCLGDSYTDMHRVISGYCFIFDPVTRTALDAVATGNWTTFCSGLDEANNCIGNILYPFNCTKGYLEAAMHLMYVTTPPYCLNDSYAFDWLVRYGYGLNTGSKNYQCVYYIIFVAVVAISMILRNE